jgi:hypothetical protein
MAQIGLPQNEWVSQAPFLGTWETTTPNSPRRRPLTAPQAPSPQIEVDIFVSVEEWKGLNVESRKIIIKVGL